MRKPGFLDSLALLAVLLAGCSSSTSPNGSPAITIPNPGSYFIIALTYTDSTGRVLQADTVKSVILSSNATIYGKTGVLVDLDSETGGWSTDTGYNYFDDNGNVGAYEQSGNGSVNPAGWITYPFASQGTSTWFTLDTSFNPYTESNITATLSGNGSGSTTILGQTFQTENAKLTVLETDTTRSNGSVFTIDNLVYVSFAPALGFVVSSSQPGVRDYAGAPLNTSFQSQVIGYSLK
jgi:hypothetical protein